jgi:hypothetical protein
MGEANFFSGEKRREIDVRHLRLEKRAACQYGFDLWMHGLLIHGINIFMMVICDTWMFTPGVHFLMNRIEDHQNMTKFTEDYGIQ